MITADDDDDEKTKILRRKLIKNIVEAKLRNERESERLGRRLGDLAKEEEREIRNIQRSLVSLRRELNVVEPGTPSDSRLKVRNDVVTHVADKGDFLANAAKREGNSYQRRHSECSSRAPMSFLELRRLPPLKSTDEGLVVWPLPPVRHDKRLDFPVSLKKQRKSLALPKIELPAESEKAGRRRRLQSSPAVLSHVSKSQLGKINRATSTKQPTPPSLEEADEE